MKNECSAWSNAENLSEKEMEGAQYKICCCLRGESTQH